MKQISISQVVEAFGDEPTAIGDRLKALGVDDEVLEQFSTELLSAKVYASSFVKFLHDNKQKLGQESIPSADLPDSFKSVFDAGPISIKERLMATGLSHEQINGLFNPDLLNLLVESDEFIQIMKINQKQFLTKLGEVASKEN